ncbi:hypothetical protein [Mycoplasmopsis cricetuli]|uniref:hypothetical protein n=1 Tax=Mycoplasmopsis cricetuli TaxID=171283 RepID=UPI0004704CBA|nr:hypothetical protein [Mycoplasmopsis cricetuli]
MIKKIKIYFQNRRNKIYFYFWKNRIEFTLKEFEKLSLIQKTKIDSWITFDGKKWKNLETFIQEFILNLVYQNKTNLEHQKMIEYFYYYFFYELAYKMNNSKIKIVFLKNQPFLKSNKILIQEQKRNYYYQFLNIFKKMPNYNIVLIRLLKKIR